jgi:hypothetical protein
MSKVERKNLKTERSITSKTTASIVQVTTTVYQPLGTKLCSIAHHLQPSFINPPWHAFLWGYAPAFDCRNALKTTENEVRNP